MVYCYNDRRFLAPHCSAVLSMRIAVNLPVPLRVQGYLLSIDIQDYIEMHV